MTYDGIGYFLSQFREVALKYFGERRLGAALYCKIVQKPSPGAAGTDTTLATCSDTGPQCLYVNEVSEIVDVARLRGPEIPEVVEELFRTPVITPGRRGMNPVPVFFHMEVRVN